MGQLQWQPTESFSVLYTYDRTRIDEIPEAPWVTNVNRRRPLAGAWRLTTRSRKTIVLTTFSSTVSGSPTPTWTARRWISDGTSRTR